MGVIELLMDIVGGGRKDEEILGVISEGPMLVANEDSSPGVLVFRLDSRPDLVFHQVVRPLAPEHKRGDRVKVYCHVNEDGTTLVEWVEKACDESM